MALKLLSTVAMRYLNQERRVRERVGLRCGMQLFLKSEAAPVDATTVNISSDGLYCLSPLPLAVGDVIECTVYFDSWGFRAANAGFSMHCRLHVVRVEELRAGFGAGCRIEDYHLTPSFRNVPSERAVPAYSGAPS
jgi:hypothetical protein